MQKRPRRSPLLLPALVAPSSMRAPTICSLKSSRRQQATRSSYATFLESSISQVPASNCVRRRVKFAHARRCCEWRFDAKTLTCSARHHFDCLSGPNLVSCNKHKLWRLRNRISIRGVASKRRHKLFFCSICITVCLFLALRARFCRQHAQHHEETRQKRSVGFLCCFGFKMLVAVCFCCH